nr:immunoglobulin M heavy chain [Triakis scyllium]
MRTAISLSLLLTFLSGVQSEIVLTQPEAETGRPGGSLKLTCKTSDFDLSSNWMGWIRQVPGQGLEWLVSYYDSSNNYYASGIQGRFTASKDTSNNIFALDVTSLKTEDTAIYYCAGTYLHFDYWGQGTMVTVTAATPSPPTLYSLVSSCQQHNSDGTITYGCLAMDYSPDVSKLTWKKDGQPIPTGFKTYPSVRNTKGTYILSSQLTITDSEGECPKIDCEVRHSGSVKSIGMQCDSPPTIILTVSSSEEITSRKSATIVCSIIDFQPKSMTVEWLKNGKPVDSGIVTSPPCEVNGKFSASSRLTVSAREWLNKAVYTCQATHQGFIQRQNISGSQEPPHCPDTTVTIQPPPIEQVLLEATVTLACIISNAPYGVNVSWIRDRKYLKSEIAEKPGADPDSVVSNLNISTQDWLSAAVFDCVVSHQDLPTPIRKSIHKETDPNPREPFVSVLLPSAEEVSAQRFVSLSCLVRGFSPREIFVKWTVNDKPVNPGNYRNTEVVAENGNSPFFMYSLLSIAAEEWSSGASCSCVVGHEAIPLKIINRTVDKSSGKPSFVNISLALMDTVNSCQ